jgi:chromosome segregation and condensation protein ScpB
MPRTKLTDSQLVILNIAAKSERPIGKDDLSGLKVRGAALNRVIADLIKKDLLKEVRVKPSAPFWVRNENGQVKALVITRNGLAALGIDPDAKAAKPHHVKKTSARATKTKKPKESNSSTAPAPRANTKKAQLLDLLTTDEGVTIEQLAKTFSWQAHTVRAALTGLRKTGYEIERSAGDGTSRYRIVGTREAA